MKISTIKDLLEADVICNEENLGKHVYCQQVRLVGFRPANLYKICRN